MTKITVDLHTPVKKMKPMHGGGQPPGAAQALLPAGCGHDGRVRQTPDILDLQLGHRLHPSMLF